MCFCFFAIGRLSAQITKNDNALIGYDSTHLNDKEFVFFYNYQYGINIKKGKKMCSKGWKNLFDKNIYHALKNFNKSFCYNPKDTFNIMGIYVIGLLLNNSLNDSTFRDKLIVLSSENARSIWFLAGLLSSKRKLENYTTEVKLLKAYLIDGYFKIQDENGKTKIKGCFKNHLKTGKWKYYDEDGNIYKEEYYKKDILLKK